MPRSFRTAAAASLAAALALTAGAPAVADAPDARAAVGQPVELRVATYNLSLNRAAEGQLESDLATGENAQAQTVAEIIQRANPDVVLLNEFDYVEGGRAVDLFRENYLEVPQGGAEAVEYPYAFVAPSNTGIPSGFDLNNDGTVGGGDDAFGFGVFEGQYGMAVLSKYPIDTDAVRTFQTFLWKDMPGALLPDDPSTPEPADWFTPEELEVVRLSSKSHWDVPVQVGNKTVHVLASHPTPPTFDGPEDRNGRRNHDEIRFWADYVTAGPTSSYIYDDEGRTGGLKPGSRFVVMGDQNADPHDGDSYDVAIDQLLGHPRITDPLPTSEGAVEAAELQGGANAAHTGDPAYDTADFADNAPGNLRADYVLPSKNLQVRDAGVFWPVRSDPLSRLTGEYPFPSSDHRLVWVDVKV
ncbi:endonuclease/exonuclease/phosphatase family protein [Isoptericola variabilis]|uniref:Endonuclease/exonuclease/phosphatase n=1 Tax=Isoptericola variabilis (strain 225) TaxID=743718 RepID=F6FRA4_ISOV2|nr:endonuclease/exonuclease/phosphatase family protein [Isoptericola variabilis]AEG42964.1 Endonuclease/exonuclease/phosphatase [Isoptericola variabilis 225]TWH30064.1 endonuclease/exonuclease/phosphatase family protein [Isoptericola variabilis J7]